MLKVKFRDYPPQEYPDLRVVAAEVAGPGDFDGTMEIVVEDPGGRKDPLSGVLSFEQEV